MVTNFGDGITISVRLGTSHVTRDYVHLGGEVVYVIHEVVLELSQALCNHGTDTKAGLGHRGVRIIRPQLISWLANFGSLQSFTIGIEITKALSEVKLQPYLDLRARGHRVNAGVYLFTASTTLHGAETTDAVTARCVRIFTTVFVNSSLAVVIGTIELAVMIALGLEAWVIGRIRSERAVAVAFLHFSELFRSPALTSTVGGGHTGLITTALGTTVIKIPIMFRHGVANTSRAGKTKRLTSAVRDTTVESGPHSVLTDSCAVDSCPGRPALAAAT